jgi:uncharacterized membrane protein HdeD (DUF308 family)
MIADNMKAAYNRTKWGIALRGVFAILIGFVILARPMASVAALALVVALWSLIEGVSEIMHGFELRAMVQHWWVLLLAGVVSVLFGIAALYYYPGLSLAFIVIWAAWWLITTGVIGAYVAFMERGAGLSWGWTMTWALVAVAAGLLALMYPGVTLGSILGLVAAFAIVSGVVRLVIAFRLQSLQSDVRRSVGQPLRT